MTPIIAHDSAMLYHGDAKDISAELPPESVDALVTDPPAGIGFMGKGWDSDKGGRDAWVAWLEGVLRGALTVLKPGAHALVWALPRTSHWTATALENAGFEVRDVVMHLFGTGFPKSLDVAKAGAGADWDGWGTALKPAAEHWILARKPLAGTVACNVLQYGTGGLNVDGCRVASTDKLVHPAIARASNLVLGTGLGAGSQTEPGGRFPANVLLSHSWPCWHEGREDYLCPICGEVRQSGECSKCGTRKGRCAPGCAVSALGEHARFYFCAKPSRSERDAGCEALPVRSGGEATDREEGSAGLSSPRAGAGRGGGARNFHPTVKAQALMRYLCRLITPPGGVVLDLFTGSGSTGVAALAEGFSFIGVEQSAEYLPIARARIEAALPKVKAA